MEKKLTPELRNLKEEFDFTHKKIGELEWKIATMQYGRKCVVRNEYDILYDQLASYRGSMEILVERIRNEVSKANMEQG